MNAGAALARNLNGFAKTIAATGDHDARRETPEVPLPGRREGLIEVVEGAHFCHIVAGVYTPVLAKHSKHFVFADAIDIWLARMQGNFEPMRKQVEGRCKSHLTDGGRSCHSVLNVFTFRIPRLRRLHDLARQRDPNRMFRLPLL
jgi:hypothetical protein